MSIMYSFSSQFCHSPILRRATVMLVALAWSSLAFCGEIHNAAKSGDLEKVKTLLKANPDFQPLLPIYHHLPKKRRSTEGQKG